MHLKKSRPDGYLVTLRPCDGIGVASRARAQTVSNFYGAREGTSLEKNSLVRTIYFSCAHYGTVRRVRTREENLRRQGRSTSSEP